LINVDFPTLGMPKIIVHKAVRLPLGKEVIQGDENKQRISSVNAQVFHQENKDTVA